MPANPVSLRRISAAMLAIACLSTGAAAATVAADKFHQAYFLEHEKGDFTAACKLYEEVAADSGVSGDLRDQVKSRLAACREELATQDLAKLMPAESVVYVELNKPGEKLSALLGKLGLLADGAPLSKEITRRVAISPTLLKQLIGVRGAAVALTGFDPFKQKPMGVAVIHPGDVDLFRGIIETALPSSGKALEPIGGFPTYDIEGQAVVTLTSRLVIVSPDRAQIEAVIRRMNGAEKGSLAGTPALNAARAGKADSVFTYFVNAKPMIPLLKGAMAASPASNQQVALVQALLDPDSLQSITGRFDFGGEGLFLDLALRLDDAHHNLLYNFLRTPAINAETLKSVPEGVAGLIVTTLNDPVSGKAVAAQSGAAAAPIVTAMDLGRELFSNITTIAAYAMAPDDSKSQGGPPLPDLGVVITVNDPAKSQALWLQALGIASLATGASGMEGATIDLDGASVRTFTFTNGPTIHFAVLGNDVLVTSSRTAMSQSLRAKKQGKSILADSAFRSSLSRVTENTTRAVLVHAGRLAAIAKRSVPANELEEIAPILTALSETSAALVLDHSAGLFRFTAQMTGVPNVGELVARKLTQEHAADEQRAELGRMIKQKKWDEALAAIDARAKDGPDAELTRKKFHVLAVGTKDVVAAQAAGEQYCDLAKNNATALNNFAWALLTESQYGHTYNELALKCSKRSNELTNLESWRFVDTLALAKFDTGDRAGAIETEKKAIKLCDDDEDGAAEMKKTLARFEAAGEKQKIADKSNAGTE